MKTVRTDRNSGRSIDAARMALDGVPYTEIGARIGVSRKTAWRLAKKGRHQLRAAEREIRHDEDQAEL